MTIISLMIPTSLRRMARRALLGSFLLGWAALMGAQEPDRSLGLEAAEVAWLKAHPVVRWTPDPAYPPIEFLGRQGQPSGLAADYARLVERKLGIKLEVVPASDWEQAVTFARDRQTDLLTNITPSEDRSAFLGFSRSYFEVPDVILGRLGGPAVASVGEMRGRKIGAVKGYEVGHWLARQSPKVDLQIYSDSSSALTQLSLGGLDAVAMDLASASWVVEQGHITNLRVMGTLGNNSALCFGVRSDWPELRGILDKTLDSLGPDERNAIRRRWFAIHDDAWGWRPSEWIPLSVGLLGAGCLGLAIWNRKLGTQLETQRHLLAKADEQGRRLTLLHEELMASLGQGLRTPLNSMVSALKLLGPGSSPDQVQALSRSCLGGGEQMLRHLNTLMDYERMGRGKWEPKPQPTDLHAFLQHEVDNLRTAAESQDVTLRMDILGLPPEPAQVDPMALRQVLSQVVGHAVAASAPGGRVEIRAGISGRGRVRVEVEDHGMGIPREVQPHVFLPFMAAPPGPGSDLQGAGLGLTLAKAMVEAQGGRIGFDTEDGRGTIFWFELPVGAEASMGHPALRPGG